VTERAEAILGIASSVAVVDGQDVTVIGDKAWIDTDEVEGFRYQVTAPAADFPGTVDKGVTVEWPKGSGSTFTVFQVIDDGTGWYTVRLEAQ